jgi:Amt family ammonium transporter
VFAPSNIPLASCGAFVLWFGWFGFNAGSTLDASNTALASIALNTMLAAAAGGAVSLIATLFKFGKADPSMTINGVLSGLVAITAGCAYVAPWSAIIIGGIAGILVVYATLMMDALKIDDPVGAVAVHGCNGLFGTVAVGLFASSGGLLTTGHVSLLLVQLLGAAVVASWGAGGGYLAAKAIDALVGLRTSEFEEEEGLDMVYHGIPAYNDLERFSDIPTGLYDFEEHTGISITESNKNKRFKQHTSSS